MTKNKKSNKIPVRPAGGSNGVNKSQKKNHRRSNTCKSFSLDLMHLSTREFEEIKDLEGLKAHLKGCKKCQKELKDLKMVDLFSFLAGPRSEKFKRGMAELSERIKKETSPVPTSRDVRAGSGTPCEVEPRLNANPPERVSRAGGGQAGIPPAKAKRRAGNA